MKAALLTLAVGVGAALLWAVLRPTPAPRPANAPAPQQHEPPSPPSAAASGTASPPAMAAAPEAAPPTSAERPLSTIRMDYEREQRDADAAAAEQQIRGIYAGEPEADGILREVRCSETVCKLDARWSRHWNKPYNAALLKVIAAFGTEISFETGGPADGLDVPMAIYVRRGTGASARR